MTKRMNEEIENSTVEVEIVEEEFKAPILKDIKYPVTSMDLDSLLNEYKDVPIIDPEGENVAEEYQYVLKGHKAFVKSRNSIEKVRKELKAPCLEYGKKVDSIAKEFQAKIAQTEQALLVQRKVVEDNEERKQREYEEAERDRRDAIRLKIDTIKILPLQHYNSSSEELTKVLESLRVITNEEYEEFFEDAKSIQETTIQQLQTARTNKVATEQAEKVNLENEARLAEEQRIKDEALAKEREEFEAQKAAMQKERDDFEREKREAQEVIDLKNAEIEAERLAEEQKQNQLRLAEEQKQNQLRLAEEQKQNQLRLAREQEERKFNNQKELLDLEQDTLNAMDDYKHQDELLRAIIDGLIPNLKWEV